MPLTFRNLQISPDDPVRTWPTEAVQTALERGGAHDWHRIAIEIGSDPWGCTARQVEEIVTFDRPYGVANLMETIIARARERAVADERAEVAAEVRAAVESSGITRTELACRLGTSPSRLSTYATGRVVPSATFMVRLRRTVARQRQGGTR